MGVISNGTTLLDAGALDSGVATGAMTLIKSLTLGSAAASISFVDGASDVVFDGTYKEYVFKFINIHPNADGPDYTFNVSIDSGSNYNVTKTSTQFNARQSEGDSTGFSYISGNDLAQGTGFQIIGDGVGAGNDESLVGTLQLFDPSSTTFVKHFIARINNYRTNDNSYDVFTAGYANTTSAVNAIQFKFGSGNIDTGTIKMYGIK